MVLRVVGDDVLSVFPVSGIKQPLPVYLSGEAGLTIAAAVWHAPHVTVEIVAMPVVSGDRATFRV